MKRITKYTLVGHNYANGPECVFRADGYTSNGFWAIKDEYQGKIIEKRPTAPVNQPPIGKIIPTLDNTELMTRASEIPVGDNIPMYVLFGENNTAHVNAYFYNYFVKNGIEVYQKTNMQLSPLILAKDSQVIGVIMPISNI